MKHNIVKPLALVAAVLFLSTGCSRNKELEQLNKEQARVISDMQQEVARLKEELNRVQASQAQSASQPQASRDLRAVIK